MIRIRFVTSDDTISSMIRLQAGVCMPFTPSHTEALTQDGKFYIGAHIDGGIQARPVGYDKFLHEKIVEIPCSQSQETAFYGFVHSKIGEPYDWKSILSFVDPEINLHTQNHLICSAMMTAALRACDYFQWPLTVPFHHVSLRDLFLILSSHTQINH